jgi:hypothetical protein
MRIRILTASALVNEKTERRAGLYEEVDAPRDRAEYLISVGAAEALNEPETADEDDEGDKDRNPAPKLPEGPAGGATTTEGTDPGTGEPQGDKDGTEADGKDGAEPTPAPAPVPADEKKAAPAAPAPVRRPAPKTK